MAGWVLDSLIGCLQSPMWRYPVDSFLDHHCVVFDPGEENKFSYTEVHKEYQTMVENLLESFMSDLGITPEMFTEACSQTGKMVEEHENLFEQILAADDFLVFKHIMVQRNIDLELQALALLQKQLGHSPEAYQAGGREPPKHSHSDEDDRILQEVLRQSKREFDLQHSLDEDELERLIGIAKEESLRLSQGEQQKMAEQMTEELERVTLLSDGDMNTSVAEENSLVTQQQQTSILGLNDEKSVGSKLGEQQAYASSLLASATTGANSPPSLPTTGTNSPPSLPTTGANSPPLLPTTGTNSPPSLPTTGANSPPLLPTTGANSPPSLPTTGANSPPLLPTTGANTPPSLPTTGANSPPLLPNTGTNSPPLLPTTGANSPPLLPTTPPSLPTGATSQTKPEQKLSQDKPPPPQSRKQELLRPVRPSAGTSSKSQLRELSGSEAAAKWLESAKSEVQQPTSSGNSVQEASGPSPEDLREREAYLRQQRDRLLEMKRKARAQEFSAYTASQSSSTSKSTQVAKSAAQGELRQGHGRGGGGQKRGHNTGVLCTAIAGRLKKELAAQENHS